MFRYVGIHSTYTGYDVLIGRAQASGVEGQEFDSQWSQTNDLQNEYASLASLELGIRIEWLAEC